jgi:hypothetical protein
MSVADVERNKKRRFPELRPHTREHQLLTVLDWRSREAKVLVAARRDLTAHVGGHPNSRADFIVSASRKDE